MGIQLKEERLRRLHPEADAILEELSLLCWSKGDEWGWTRSPHPLSLGEVGSPGVLITHLISSLTCLSCTWISMPNDNSCIYHPTVRQTFC